MWFDDPSWGSRVRPRCGLAMAPQPGDRNEALNYQKRRQSVKERRSWPLRGEHRCPAPAGHTYGRAV
jgi:hypothetical protein